MKNKKEIAIHIHCSDNKLPFSVCTRFHTKYIERYLENLSLPVNDKIKILSKIIECLKLDIKN